MSRRSDYPRRDRRRQNSGDDSFADVVNAFTFGAKPKRDKREERSEPEAPPQDRELDQRARTVSQDPAEAASEVPVASSIRSYTWTGGRTKSNHELAIETLVSVGENYRPGAPVRLEHQSIAELCQQPRSVAEVGALLSVPIGVARVLLADMAELGLITVHNTVSESGSAPHMLLMERVLSGLRRL
ncbi:DUF742 domain-containing protein [Saccharopolyspora rhizosphaerae]|uniref:DUF742 domain-containing protein n=1 Tax=Saccharopolyspora rhizosphaerae TaxID=2492662 RepID=A0A426JQD7_9PSEU|nr:DUF742 domain-containing protein [Saccharopolyspora rhizosphaerae]RRO15409.1 DUF742 domain-containing protein [Saccharopolyspora rhizosphaerae]